MLSQTIFLYANDFVPEHKSNHRNVAEKIVSLKFQLQSYRNKYPFTKYDYVGLLLQMALFFYISLQYNDNKPVLRLMVRVL